MLNKIINFIMWLVAIFILLMTLGMLFTPVPNKVWAFLTFLLSAMMFAPPVQEKIRIKTKKNIKLIIYLVVGFILFIVGMEMISGDNEKIKETNEKNTLSVQETSKQESDEDKQAKEDSMKVEEQSQPEPIAQESEEPEVIYSTWQYDNSEDEMRGETSYFASNESINTVELQFPYQGGTRLNILLRDNAKHDKDIMFIVNKGQIFCGFQDCHVNIKFDDGEVQRYETSEAEAGSSEVLFLTNNVSGFVKRLKDSETVMVEVNFYNHGAEQFKFDVSGLEWSRF